jgi:hypothetical protein
MRTPFLILLFLLICLEVSWGKTVIVPKRETAKSYILSLTNISTNKTLEFESKKGKFELPQDLDGEFSLQVSFIDKWGRRIEGQEPKIIKIISKIAKADKSTPLENQTKDSFGIVFAPYLASGTYEADLGNNSSGLKKIKEPLSAFGIKTILKFQSFPKYFIGLERFQGTSSNAKINFTEVSVSYEMFSKDTKNENFKAEPGLAFNSAQLTAQFIDEEDTVNPDIKATSGYIYGKLSYLRNIEALGIKSEAIIGASLNYFRYSFSQSIYYRFNNRFSAGPWFEYAKFENGSTSGSIRSNLISLGLLLNANL